MPLSSARETQQEQTTTTVKFADAAEGVGHNNPGQLLVWEMTAAPRSRYESDLSDPIYYVGYDAQT